MILRLLVLATVSLALSAPALAITGGTLDGSTHPAVGLLVGDAGNGPKPLCSGTLVSPKVFLTAGHCTADLPTSRVFVSFDTVYTSSSTAPSRHRHDRSALRG